MDDLDRQLKNALSRKEPPAWFNPEMLEAKVLAASRRPQRSTFLRWVVAMASVLVIAIGIWTDHRAGVRAKTQLELALKITATQLTKIQKTVRASTEEE
jgi:hypothetical protein